MFYRLAYPQVADLLTVARALLVEILTQTHQTLESTVAMSGTAADPAPVRK